MTYPTSTFRLHYYSQQRDPADRKKGVGPKKKAWQDFQAYEADCAIRLADEFLGKRSEELRIPVRLIFLARPVKVYDEKAHNRTRWPGPPR